MNRRMLNVPKDFENSKLENVTNFGKTGLNRTYASPKWDRTRCSEEHMSSFGVTCPLQMFC